MVLPKIVKFYGEYEAKKALKVINVVAPEVKYKKVTTYMYYFYCIFYTGGWNSECENLVKDFMGSFKIYVATYEYESDYYGPPGKMKLIIKARNREEAEKVFNYQVGYEAEHGHSVKAATLLSLEKETLSSEK